MAKFGKGTLATALMAAIMPVISPRASAQDVLAKPATTATDVSPAAAAPASPKTNWVKVPVNGPNSKQFLPVADMRGRGEALADILALGTSDKNSVVLLVQGNNQKIIDDAQRELADLMFGKKYNRLALVIGDGPEDIAYVYAKGHRLTTLTNLVKAENRGYGFFTSTEELYEKHVLPELKAAETPTASR